MRNTEQLPDHIAGTVGARSERNAGDCRVGDNLLGQIRLYCKYR